MLRDDASYFVRRAAEELRAAECATSPEAERAHRELHRCFAAMVEEQAALAAAQVSSGAPSQA